MYTRTGPLHHHHILIFIIHGAYLYFIFRKKKNGGEACFIFLVMHESWRLSGFHHSPPSSVSLPQSRKSAPSPPYNGIYPIMSTKHPQLSTLHSLLYDFPPISHFVAIPLHIFFLIFIYLTTPLQFQNDSNTLIDSNNAH